MRHGSGNLKNQQDARGFGLFAQASCQSVAVESGVFNDLLLRSHQKLRPFVEQLSQLGDEGLVGDVPGVEEGRKTRWRHNVFMKYSFGTQILPTSTNSGTYFPSKMCVK